MVSTMIDEDVMVVAFGCSLTRTRMAVTGVQRRVMMMMLLLRRGLMLFSFLRSCSKGVGGDEQWQHEMHGAASASQVRRHGEG